MTGAVDLISAPQGAPGPARRDDGHLSDVLYRHRYKELDGLRGLASLSVGIFHSITATVALPAASLGAIILPWVARVMNGALAVDLFFILSGFVLSGMIGSSTSRFLSRYFARRLARLAPPAMASVCVFLIFLEFVFGTPRLQGASAAFIPYVVENHVITAKTFVLNLCLIRHSMNPALWTIRVEILASLIFPFVLFLKNRLSFIWYKLAVFAATVIIAVMFRNHQILGLDVLHYLYMFYAGALARDFGPALARINSKRSLTLLIISALATIAAASFLQGDHSLTLDVPVTISGAVFIGVLAFGQGNSATRFFNTPGMQYLGRISYSYYLVSNLFVIGVTGLALNLGLPAMIDPAWTIAIIALTSTFCTLIFGSLFHIAIERPAMALSRSLGRTLPSAS